MCGIAGTVNCTLTQNDIDLLYHRGPDFQALVEISDDPVRIFLGHTRLSILDLTESGNQPMFSECGKYGIVFNGEIYNHLELRTKLSGINFKGHSDTETILYYLRKFGIDAVKDFNGIFSFALLDRNKQKVYLVRDFFGVKPLYYFIKNNTLIFASEIKIIKNNPVYQKEIDIDALNTFLTFRYNPSPQTLFKNINKLQASTYLEFDFSGKTRFCNYWPSHQKINGNISEKDAIAEYKHLLKKAVERQLLSDVPVGLLLSGGLDSALLGYLMAENYSNPIKTFTVGFEGKGDFNELYDARDTAKYIQSDHYDIIMSKEEYMNYFYDSFYHTEEPIAEPTIPALFYVSKLASKYVKVVLSGQGADEPMAGYKRYKGEKFLSSYSKILPYMPLKLVSKVFPDNNTILRGIYSSQFKNELDRFIGIYTLFTPDLKKHLYKDELLAVTSQSQCHLFSEVYGRTDPAADSLSKMLYLDTRTMLPDNLLLFNDKITMAASIENRVPYLDIELIKFIESLPIELKLKGNTGKYIHRKAAEQWLPSSIIHRKKRGFETPVGEWFKEALSESLVDLIDNANSLSNRYFKVNFIKKMIQEHRQKKRDFKRQLFIILSLEVWHKNFYLKQNS